MKKFTDCCKRKTNLLLAKTNKNTVDKDLIDIKNNKYEKKGEKRENYLLESYSIKGLNKLNSYEIKEQRFNSHTMKLIEERKQYQPSRLRMVQTLYK